MTSASATRSRRPSTERPRAFASRSAAHTCAHQYGSRRASSDRTSASRTSFDLPGVHDDARRKPAGDLLLEQDPARGLRIDAVANRGSEQALEVDDARAFAAEDDVPRDVARGLVGCLVDQRSSREIDVGGVGVRHRGDVRIDAAAPLGLDLIHERRGGPPARLRGVVRGRLVCRGVLTAAPRRDRDVIERADALHVSEEREQLHRAGRGAGRPGRAREQAVTELGVLPAPSPRELPRSGSPAVDVVDACRVAEQELDVLAAHEEIAHRLERRR